MLLLESIPLWDELLLALIFHVCMWMCSEHGALCRYITHSSYSVSSPARQIDRLRQTDRHFLSKLLFSSPNILTAWREAERQVQGYHGNKLCRVLREALQRHVRLTVRPPLEFVFIFFLLYFSPAVRAWLGLSC